MEFEKLTEEQKEMALDNLANFLKRNYPLFIEYSIELANYLEWEINEENGYPVMCVN